MTNEQKKELLKEFITNNNLTFEEGSRNQPATIISGYALFIDADGELIIEALEELKKLEEETTGFIYDGCVETDVEIRRVFEYANNNNYGDYFAKESTKKEYKY